MARQPEIQYIHFYTDGSAARKAQPVAPLKTLRLPQVKKRKRITLHVDPVAVISIMMAAVMAVLIVAGAVRLNTARQEMQTMAAYVDTLKQENDQLKQTFSTGYDIEEIERTALALGFVPREQVKHVTIRVPEVQIEEEPGAWERVYTFLTGLFA